MSAFEQRPEQLVGWFVIEIGLRQAWPFVTFADPATGRELCLFLDAEVTVTPAGRAMRQDDEDLLAALTVLNGLTVTDARSVADDLVVDFDGQGLRVSGLGNELTGGSPWWFGLRGTN